MSKVKELIEELGIDEPITVLENPSYDTAFIGLSHNDRAVYSYDKMIEFLIVEEDMTLEDAVDFIDYNTIRALGYIPNSPIVLYDLGDMI